MWTKSFNFEVIVICFLSLIPWPGPSVFKISCSRESARVVRKIVQSKWLPILDKYQVKIPLECPFHPVRDIFGPQQAAKKQNRPSQWTCGFCGKSFYEEKHLDMHFESRHNSNINMAEDAICLADYCDIMRCKVLVSKDSTLSFGDPSIMSTDIEIWREATVYRTALQPTGPRDLAKLPARNNFLPSLLHLPSSKLNDGEERVNKAPTTKQHCDKRDKDQQKAEEEDSVDDDDEDLLKDAKTDPTVAEDGDDGDESDSNATSSCDGNLVDSSIPPSDRKEQRISELQKMKANCKSEDLDKLKIRCEILVRNCIVGLLGQMSDDDFKNMEDELNRAVCWYLTCDRYWEDGPIEQRAFPWGLVFVLVMVLSLGVCFCYYIIWILFDTDEHGSILSTGSFYTIHSSPTHHQHLHAATAGPVGIYPQQQSSQLHQQHQQLQQHHMQQQQQHQQHHSPHLPQQQPHLHASSSLSSSIGGVASAGSSSGGHHLPLQSAPAVVAQPPIGLNPSMTVAPATGGGAGTYANDEFFAGPEFNEAGQSEHYIYVTYPPELKRRLLESCYNRTTRL